MSASLHQSSPVQTSGPVAAVFMNEATFSWRCGESHSRDGEKREREGEGKKKREGEGEGEKKREGKGEGEDVQQSNSAPMWMLCNVTLNIPHVSGVEISRVC